MYRDEDIDKIYLNMDKIKDNAAEQYKLFNEPTLKENEEVFNTIKNFIITNNKIVYGGIAQNLLIRNKNPKDVFYKEINNVFYHWPDIADIEFYSSSPIEDAINLTEELLKRGFKNIEAKEAVKPETYKIFVNFVNYCDISYMPTNIYVNLPTININGLTCVSPYFMAVDAYRVVTDPMISYWRLDKTIKRFQLILKYYQFKKLLINNTIILHNNFNNDIKKYIRKKIIQNSKLIIIGYHAYNYYVKKVYKNLIINNFSYYEAISENFINDAKIILKILKLKYLNIKTKEYYPFYEFFDTKIEYYHNDILIFVLYDNNKRCTVLNYSHKKKTNFGTFNLVLLYLLFSYFYHVVNKLKHGNNMIILINNLFSCRIKYLENHNISVLDKSPYQDFSFKCYGIPVDPLRESFLQRKSKKYKFKYIPTNTKIKIPEHKFVNNSGNQILNEKYFILKKNNI
jgi:hypothetical protein